MHCTVVGVKNKPDWYVCVVSHTLGVFNYRWELGAESPYKTDCDVRARAFNDSVDHVVNAVVDIYRPSLSMCENAYAGKTEPRKL